MNITDVRTPGTSLTRTAALGICLAFVTLGAVQAAYGPAVPALAARFGLSPATAGLALTVHFVGALIGDVLAPPLRRRLGNRPFLVASLGVLAAGAAGFAVAPAWPPALAGAFVGGLGFGLLNVGGNEVFIEHYGTTATGMLNLLHGTFGVGAVVAPLVIGALPVRLYGWAFAVWALLALAAIPLMAGAAGRPARGRGARVLLWWPLALFMAFFILHVGVESSAGGWETTHLTGLGRDPGTAAMLSSGFWLAMTASRFALGPLARHLTVPQIVFGGLALMGCGSLLAFAGDAAPLGYVVIGLGVGPLFPTGLVWLARKAPGGTAPVVAVALAGGLLTSVVGGAVGRWGYQAVPVALAAGTACCLALALLIATLDDRSS
ncbi:MFS transporter [Actinomadura parmotrematis]|uniref:MFS transporter n=1 Tax=Actinomadura parmotrematis TaxID=2864039 RepID=A0ABS7FQQ0_9ACTN|nr:MFS transporter [Actinomadura parmotrematis]MBW8482049.1 MFS transporter [Actinomadura parmotrematis]